MSQISYGKVVIVISCLLILFSCQNTGKSKPSSSFINTGKMIYSSGGYDDHDIFIYDFSTKAIVNLTKSDGIHDWMPSLSASDKIVTFSSNKDGDYDIYFMELEKNTSLNSLIIHMTRLVHPSRLMESTLSIRRQEMKARKENYLNPTPQVPMRLD